MESMNTHFRLWEFSGSRPPVADVRLVSRGGVDGRVCLFPSRLHYLCNDPLMTIP